MEEIHQIQNDKRKSENILHVHIRWFLTICLAVCYFGIGVSTFILGPSLVHLTYLYHTNVAAISVSFTCQFAGMLVGSTLSAIIFDRNNRELQLVIGSVLFYFI